MKKKIILAVIGIFTLAALSGAAYYFRDKLFGPKVKGELKASLVSPQGEDVPISVDGISVIFDSPVISMTTLDSARDKKIDLKITPKIEGDFFWLGTTGFIFRPKAALNPGTTYTVSIPDNLVSYLGMKLNEPVEWSFTTVGPRVIKWNPAKGTTILPKGSSIFITFNVAMNTRDVEKNIKLIDVEKNSEVPLLKKFVWSDGDHILEIRFAEEIPSGIEVDVVVPKGVKSKSGDYGMAEDSLRRYKVFPSEFVIKGVSLQNSVGGDYYESDGKVDENVKYLDPNSNPIVQAGSAVCYDFSQPVTVESFKKSVKLGMQDNSEISFEPYYFFKGYVSYPSINEKEEFEKIEGYTSGCISFLDDYNKSYKFSVDPEKIEALSGARLLGKTVEYKISTGHSESYIKSLVTKNIISFNGQQKIPYRVMNVESLKLNIYKIANKADYNESIRNQTLIAAQKYDESTKKYEDVLPKVSEPLAGHLSLPIDPLGNFIDQSRMKPYAVIDMPIAEKLDSSEKISIDLNELGTGKLSPGIYIIEALGKPKLEGLSPPESVYTMIQVTPVAIAAKRSPDRILVYATDVESGLPLPGLKLKVTYDRGENKPVYESEAITNDKGVAINFGPYGGYGSLCVESTDASLWSYSCTDIHQLDYSYVPSVEGGFFDFIFTDRPIYRPGQTVYFSSFIRDEKDGRYFMPPVDTMAEVWAIDAAGKEIYRKKSKIESGGIVTDKFDLPSGDSAPRGYYWLYMDIGGKKFSKDFSVTSYRKPTFKVSIDDPQSEIISGQTITAKVKGEYFFGAPMQKADLSWYAMRSDYDFSKEGYESFSFSNSEGYGRESSKTDLRNEDPFLNNREKNETLDAGGVYSIEYKTDISKYPVSQKVTIEADVTDPSGQMVSGYKDIIVHKGNFYFGVKPERWVYGENQTARIDIVSFDTKGNPVKGKGFKVDVYSREYKYVQRRGASGFWESIFEHQDTKLKTLSGKTDSTGKSFVNFQLPKGGTYGFVVYAEDDLSGNKIESAGTAQAWGKGYVPWKLDEGSNGIELVPDKSVYKVGDTAKILVKTMVPASKALVTLERGSIAEYKIFDLNGNADKIEFKITEGMVPNIFVSMIVQTGRTEDHPPLLFSGDANLKVSREEKAIKLNISTDRKGEGKELPIYKPGDNVDISVEAKDSKGLPVKGRIIAAVVDEAVLSLSKFKLPDLLDIFYSEQYKNVATSSSMVSLKAGDGQGDLSSAKKRKDFKDTAYFAGNVPTDDNGKAVVKFKLPDDLTTWRIEILAISDSKSREKFEEERKTFIAPEGESEMMENLEMSDGTLVGSAESKFMTALPVSIRTALPRFAAWKDEITAKAILNNKSPSLIEGTLEIKTSEGFIFRDGKNEMTRSFAVKNGSEEIYQFDIVAKDNSEKGMVSITAKDKEGKVVDSLEQTIPIIDRSTPEYFASSGITDSKAVEGLNIPPEISYNKGGLDVSLAASLGISVADSLHGLIYFPWGCSEQKSSSLAALLMTEDLVRRFGDKYFDAIAPIPAGELPQNASVDDKRVILTDKIRALISELSKKYLLPSGGVLYWPEDVLPNYYSTAQLYWIFNLANSLNYNVDQKVMDNLSGYLSRMTGKKGCDTFDCVSYGYWALSLEKIPVSEVESKLLDNLSDLTVSGLSYLLMGLDNFGKTAEIERVKERLINLSDRTPRSASWEKSDFFFSSAVKNTALAAHAIYMADKNNPIVPLALNFLLNSKKSRQFVSTQDALYLSWLAYDYSKMSREDKTDFSAVVDINGQKILEKSFNKENILEAVSNTVNAKDLASFKMPAEIDISKSGEGSLYYNIVLKYYLSPEETPTREEGIVISREYYDLNDTKEEKPLEEFEAGKTYKGHIIVSIPRTANYIVVTDPVPAGFEPVDMNLSVSSYAEWLKANKSENSPAGEEEIWDYSFDIKPPYDDDVKMTDFGSDYKFSHREIKDDSYVWSDKQMPEGIYHIRYPVRATTAGKYIMSGASAFEFYEPEVFGRSKSRIVVVK